MKKGHGRDLMVPLYFHLGGIGAGCYALGLLVLVADGPGSARLARLGFLASAAILVGCGGLLTTHLTRPERFWRVLTRFKWYSPISVGAWGLVFATAAAGATAASLLVQGETAGAAWLAGSFPGRLLAGVGGLAAWFVTAYTGVLLAASSRPAWTATHQLGGVFCVTGLATAAAFLRLLELGAGNSPAALVARLDRTGGALLLLATAAWFGLVWAGAGAHSHLGPTRLLLERPPWGPMLARGVAVGYLGAGLLMLRGGWVAPLGAILAVTVGLMPRAALVGAGEDLRPARA